MSSRWKQTSEGRARRPGWHKPLRWLGVASAVIGGLWAINAGLSDDPSISVTWMLADSVAGLLVSFGGWRMYRHFGGLPLSETYNNKL